MAAVAHWCNIQAPTLLGQASGQLHACPLCYPVLVRMPSCSLLVRAIPEGGTSLCWYFKPMKCLVKTGMLMTGAWIMHGIVRVFDRMPRNGSDMRNLGA